MKFPLLKASCLWLLCTFLALITTKAQETRSYADPDNLFTAALPSVWQSEAVKENVRFHLHPKGDSVKSLIMEVEDLPEESFDITLQQLAAMTAEGLMQSAATGNITITEKEYLTIKNIRWFIIGFSDKAIRNTAYITLNNKKIYRLYYTAPLKEYDKDAAVAKAVISSIQFGRNLNNTVQATAVGNTSSDNQTLSKNVFENSKAGTIAPDAIKLDVDEMGAFFGKFAVLKKGQVQALINDKGQIIVPYTKYTFTQSSTEDYYAGDYHWHFGYSFYPTANYYGALAKYQNKIGPVKLIPFTEIKTGKTGYITSDGKSVFPTKTPKGYGVNGWALSAFDTEGYCNEISAPYWFEEKLSSVKYDGSEITGRGNLINKKQVNYKVETYTGDYRSEKNMPGLVWTNGLLPASSPSAAEANVQNLDYKDPAKELAYQNNRIGFINRKGEFKIKPAFYQVGQFSEGIAWVSKKDEFNNVKWGAIDSNGTLVIPYKFRFEPSRFSFGLALIKAVDLDKIDYAFINKKGDILFTIPKNSGDTIDIKFPTVISEPSTIFNETYSGFYFIEGYQVATIRVKDPSARGSIRTDIVLFDTAGHFFPIQKEIEKKLTGGHINIPSFIKMPIKDGKLIFQYYSNSATGTGIADVHGNIIIPPVFNDLRLFDKDETLQYAHKGKGKKWPDDPDPSTEIEGYIDREGVFRIIKVKEKSGF